LALLRVLREDIVGVEAQFVNQREYVVVFGPEAVLAGFGAATARRFEAVAYETANAGRSINEDDFHARLLAQLMRRTKAAPASADDGDLEASGAR
jgi:hypothetical protein